MLEGIDIEAMGIGMAKGLREQAAKGTPAAKDAVEETLSHASTADIARDLIDRNILAGAETAIARDFAAEPGLAADLRESVATVRERSEEPTSELQSLMRTSYAVFCLK